MECPKIDNIKFDKNGLQALKRMSEYEELANALAIAFGLGSIVTLFQGGTVRSSAKSIKKHDWEVMAEAMRASSDFARSRVELLAYRQMRRFPDEIDDKQYKFWKAVYDRCHVE